MPLTGYPNPDSFSGQSRSFKLIALLILLVATGLRFVVLDRQSLWDDESFTLRDIGIIPVPLTEPEAQPPPYFDLLRIWTRIAGTSVTAVRAFSGLWGVVGVALMGLVAMRMFSPAAGLFAASLLALHTFHLAYSQEARVYTMLFVLSLACLWSAWERRPYLYLLASTATFWVHPWGLFIWLGTAPTLFRWQGLLPPLLALPLLWSYRHLQDFYGFWARKPDLSTLLGISTALAGGSFYVGGWILRIQYIHLLPLLAFVVLWVWGLRKEDERRTRRTILTGLTALVPVPLLAGVFIPEVSAHQRYWMAALPFAILLSVRGWRAFPTWARSLAATSMLAVFSISTVFYFTHWQKGNIRNAVEDVRAIAVQNAALIVPRYMQPLWCFYDKSGLPLIDEDELDVMLPKLAGRSEAIFVTLDIPNPVRDAMDAHCTVVARQRYPADFHLGIVLTRYKLQPQ